jgi:hypothetical protein
MTCIFSFEIIGGYMRSVLYVLILTSIFSINVHAESLNIVGTINMSEQEIAEISTDCKNSEKVFLAIGENLFCISSEQAQKSVNVAVPTNELECALKSRGNIVGQWDASQGRCLELIVIKKEYRFKYLMIEDLSR